MPIGLNLKGSTMFGKEFARVFRNKMFLCGLLILLAFQAILLLWKDSERHAYSPKEYNTAWKEIKGILAENDVESCCTQLQEKSKQFDTDRFDEEYVQKNQAELYNDLYEEMRALQSVGEYRNNVLENGKKLIRFSKNGSMNQFTKRDIQKTIDVYEKLSDSTTVFESYRAVSLFMGERYPIILLLIFALFLCYLLFLYEKEQGTLVLTRSCIYGRKRLAAAKLLTLAADLLIAMLVLYFLRFLILARRYGFGDLCKEIRSVPGFERCRFTLTVGQYFLVAFLLRLVVLYVCAFAFAFLCVVFGSSVLAIGSSLLTIGISVLLYVGIQGTSDQGALHFLNLWGMLRFDAIGSYLNINLFGYPIECLLCIVVLCPVAAVALVIACIECYGKIRALSLKKCLKLPAFLKFRYRVGLFAFESKRFLMECGFGIVCLMLLAVQIQRYGKIDSTVHSSERIYKQYMETLQGPYSLEKEQYLEEEKQKLEELIQNDSFGGMRYENQKAALLMASERLEYIKNTKSGELFWDYTYRNLIEKYDRKSMLLEMMTIVVLVILFGSFLFSYDVSNGMMHLLGTTQNRNRDIKYRLLIGGIETAVVTGIVVFPELIFQLTHYGIQGITKPANSIIALENYGSIPLWLFLLLYYLLRLLGVYFACVAVSWLAFQTKSVAASILIALSAFCGIPALVLLDERLEKLLFIYTPMLGSEIIRHKVITVVILMVGYIIGILFCLKQIRERGIHKSSRIMKKSAKG